MDPLYCLCGQPYDPNLFMIQCDSCRDWFHGRYATFASSLNMVVMAVNITKYFAYLYSCVNFPEHVAIEIDKYHCPRCVPVYGPSICKYLGHIVVTQSPIVLL